MSDIDIAKRGEQIFNLSFRRKDGTLRVYIICHSSVEDLIKSWGSGVTGEIYDFGGRNWIFSGSVPQIYDLSQEFSFTQEIGDNNFYTLQKVGFPFIETASSGRTIVNISFLRIVGISRGIEFELPGVHSISHLRDIQGQIQKAVKRLYTDYLLPLDLTIQVNTQETRL